MATVATELVTSAGLAATYNAASAGGDRFAPGSIVHIKNTNAAILTATLDVIFVVDGNLVVADRTLTVPATTGERFWRVPNNEVYRDPADGLVKATWSVTSGVTFAVIS